MSGKIIVSVFSNQNVLAALLLITETTFRQTGPAAPSYIHTTFASVLEDERDVQGQLLHLAFDPIPVSPGTHQLTLLAPVSPTYTFY